LQFATFQSSQNPSGELKNRHWKPKEMEQFISVACKYSENWQLESTFRPLNGTQAFAWRNFVELKIFCWVLFYYQILNLK